MQDRVDGAVFMSGGATATVLGIGSLDGSLEVRVPALPVTVSPASRFQSVKLKVIVRDCEATARWAPGDRPLTIGWRDEYGKSHVDTAGDFGRSVAVSLTEYFDAVCDHPPHT